MFVACKPYIQSGIACGERVLILDTSDLSIEYIGIGDLMCYVYEHDDNLYIDSWFS